ncbi:MAG: lysylphosphatidylglycerol synthase transmembrane domain-containing protein [Bacillota bacterium]
MTDKPLTKYQRPIITWIVIGVLITALIMMISDFRAVINILYEINLKLLPLILLLAPLNYLFRYIKWSYYLQQIGVKLPQKINTVIFISGLSMTITPGKVGELLKSYLIREYNGTEISITSPIIVAERVTDAIAMIILASVGSLAYDYGQYILLITLGCLLLGIAILYFDSLFALITGLLGRVKFFNRYLHLLENFQGSARKLFDIKSLMLAILIGVISWGFEGIVVFLSLRALGGSISVLDSIFVVSFSSIMGAISVLPGGLGVAEGSILGILLLLGVPREMAAATTLITRFSTLWLGVIIGMIGLYSAQQYIKGGAINGN